MQCTCEVVIAFGNKLQAHNFKKKIVNTENVLRTVSLITMSQTLEI